jgi:hypothetical protein
MSKVENLRTTNRAEPFPCVSVALVVLAMFVLSWLAAKGVRNNLQPLLIFAGLCLPIFIAELRNHHNKWAIIAFDAVPVITYAFGYLVLRGPVLTGSMVLWLAGFGVSICIWFAALVWACTRVRPRWVQRKEPKQRGSSIGQRGVTSLISAGSCKSMTIGIVEVACFAAKPAPPDVRMTSALLKLSM